MKISLPQTQFFNTPSFSGNVYVSSPKEKKFDILRITCRTRHYKTKLLTHTRMYFILKGKGTFTIDGKKEKATPNDLFVIRKGQIYEYAGKMTLLEINVPASGKKSEERLD